MEHTPVFVLFAEAAIALAGFTTLASVVVRLSRATNETMLALRLISVIMLATTLLIMSLIPLVIARLELPERTAWTYAAYAALVCGAVTAVCAIFVLRLVIREKANVWWQTIAASGLGYGGMGMLFAVLLTDVPAFWYVLSLSAQLGACISMVIGAIYSFPVFDSLFHREPPPQKVRAEPQDVAGA